MLRPDLVGPLFDRCPQLGCLLLVDVREVAYLLIEIRELASRPGDLDVFWMAPRGIGGHTAAEHVVRTLHWTARPHGWDLGAVNSTYLAGHADTPEYLSRPLAAGAARTLECD